MLRVSFTLNICTERPYFLLIYSSIIDYFDSGVLISLFILNMVLCACIVQVNGLMNGTCKMHRSMSIKSLAELSWMFMQTPPLVGHIGQ